MSCKLINLAEITIFELKIIVTVKKIKSIYIYLIGKLGNITN